MYKILYMSQNYILNSIYGHGTYRNRAAINVFDKLIKVLTTLASLYLTISKMRVSMGLTDRRKTAKNLVDSRKNWKILTVSRK